MQGSLGILGVPADPEGSFGTSHLLRACVRAWLPACLPAFGRGEELLLGGAGKEGGETPTERKENGLQRRKKK